LARLLFQQRISSYILINIGERAGSGVPNIFDVWADEGWKEPEIIEKFEPDCSSFCAPAILKNIQNPP